MSETEKKLSFEKALAELEEVVAKIEDGSLSLNECLKEYEKGIKLATFCAAELKNAREKIEKLQAKNDGTVEALEAEISAQRGEE